MNNYIQQNLNDRIYSRNVPSADLEPYLSNRPINTKYVSLQDRDTRQKQINIQSSQQNTDHEYTNYNTEIIFNPGSGPWSGYSSHIDIESRLRDQYYKNPCIPKYLPNYKTSDLYTINGPYLPLNIKEFPYSVAPVIRQNNNVGKSSLSKNPEITKVTFNTNTRLLR